ncbi:hypothetical protein EG328_010324 [Venturia inaequalis]|uniref:Uncharacterized protein n=1 Tax=Venturia inaequalis TaxID=5025 RepID=A0A8H3V4P4_VENIN|nr:hypothetical protein EG328_010324 [Venturia inaequalis]KAE9991983.1 hypothetical protein EG327_010459 [Venturia inaequalis]RDI89214.1 hypothetical protein Vi05172_g450 [Venturia inaequalis]
MYGLKALLFLALAGSAFACQCRQDGNTNAPIDAAGTNAACNAARGRVLNYGTENVDVSYYF